MKTVHSAAGPAADIVVAGHICLDVIPDIRGEHGGLGQLLVPGKLVDVGSATLSTGGAVSNTGLALHRLGFPVRLMGKAGDDPFGGLILQLLREHGEGMADGMIVSPGESSSYSLVISPPGVDRIFLHHTGTNDTFAAADVEPEALRGARLFHFGYPPLMRKMYEHGGEELERMLAAVKSQGLTVSLDLARPDPDSDAGKADWRAILSRALPSVDVFLPSFEEILYMLRPDTYRELAGRHGTTELLPFANGELLGALAGELLGMGVAIAGLKLGAYGFYLRTTADAQRLRTMGACAPEPGLIESWRERELLVPCFRVEAAGTTGAGDSSIAGFLGGLAKGLAPERTLIAAAGVGACCVERSDATSGVRGWDDTQERIAAGWERSGERLPLDGWDCDNERGLWEKKAGNVR
ncbi:carbohydrate kinase family protein [Cohnella fermenti]|uniref:Carbohydrate kinase family protein n=1 Tax=Cohnella fermenti TaxID=2565925 RepID=A0A4S4C5Y3_9BACL|nr:carbohydrate kinase family protein [Cohnella fermenti]THF83273.1 carbohydrate kinase family protein [Cohnella fermenti]